MKDTENTRQKILVHKDINYLSNKALEIRKNAYILYSIVEKLKKKRFEGNVYFIQQWFIKLIKSGSKYIFNITKDLYLFIYLLLSIHRKKKEKKEN